MEQEIAQRTLIAMIGNLADVRGFPFSPPSGDQEIKIPVPTSMEPVEYVLYLQLYLGVLGLKCDYKIIGRQVQITNPLFGMDPSLMRPLQESTRRLVKNILNRKLAAPDVRVDVRKLLADLSITGKLEYTPEHHIALRNPHQDFYNIVETRIATYNMAQDLLRDAGIFFEVEYPVLYIPEIFDRTAIEVSAYLHAFGLTGEFMYSQKHNRLTITNIVMMRGAISQEYHLLSSWVKDINGWSEYPMLMPRGPGSWHFHTVQHMNQVAPPDGYRVTPFTSRDYLVQKL